ncbi:hypothetical protein DFP72DRAFT_880305 [Ephemerocybe angulata]|uniref:Uncharacterized protein n=1 Tax=Ephemerocybe angulata TaxID=980116 RepID=A0A8H6I955_9AGAR|nr:hypothetical protein DFP72DRAFT_880305 [Tulosesus angulatus]
MTATFTHPPHPSSLKAKDTQTMPFDPTPEASAERDPHTIPSFELKEHKVPVLYLPPLLSSLPERIPPHNLPKEYPPLVTETRLPDIDPASLSLHKALHHYKPELELPEDEEREWYCVAFKSQRKAGSNGDALYEADKYAHEEAVHNGGLIMYWYGIPNPQTGMNLATCIWQSRKHAVAANSRPHHIKAMRLAAQSYEVYELGRYVLRKSKGEKHVAIEPYNGGEVGW